MVSSYTVLGLPVSLLLTEEQVKSAFEQTEKGELEIQSRVVLLDPAERLTGWMAENQLAVSKHSSISPAVLELFSEIAGVTQTVNDLHQKRLNATTQLAQTLLDTKLYEQKATLDSLSEKRDEKEGVVLENFPHLEESKDEVEANECLQSLKFLRKWKGEINNMYNKLLVY